MNTQQIKKIKTIKTFLNKFSTFLLYLSLVLFSCQASISYGADSQKQIELMPTTAIIKELLDQSNQQKAELAQLKQISLQRSMDYEALMKESEQRLKAYNELKEVAKQRSEAYDELKKKSDNEFLKLSGDLKSANDYFKKYSEEQHRKLNRAKFNTCLAITGGVIVALLLL